MDELYSLIDSMGHLVSVVLLLNLRKEDDGILTSNLRINGSLSNLKIAPENIKVPLKCLKIELFSLFY